MLPLWFQRWSLIWIGPTLSSWQGDLQSLILTSHYLPYFTHLLSHLASFEVRTIPNLGHSCKRLQLPGSWLEPAFLRRPRVTSQKDVRIFSELFRTLTYIWVDFCEVVWILNESEDASGSRAVNIVSVRIILAASGYGLLGEWAEVETVNDSPLVALTAD